MIMDYKACVGQYVFGYQDDDYESDRVLLNDPREINFNVRNGWYNVFSLASNHEHHEGFAVYQIQAFRTDKNGNPMFILKFIRELHVKAFEYIYVGSEEYLAVEALMSSKKFFQLDELCIRGTRTFHIENYNVPLLCEKLNQRVSENATPENVTDAMVMAFVNNKISISEINEWLTTPTPEQIAEAKRQEEEDAIAMENWKKHLEEEQEREHRIHQAKVDFMLDPSKCNQDYPRTCQRWYKEICTLYNSYQYVDGYDEFVLEIKYNILSHTHVSTSRFDAFVKRYVQKYEKEVSLGHIDAVSDDASDFAKIEAYLDFDEPRKAAKKAEKTAKKKAKKMCK